MSDNIIRELLKAEAPKTIAKEQLFVYVPQDYKDAVARTKHGAAESAKYAVESMKWATGEKFKVTVTGTGVTVSDPNLYFSVTDPNRHFPTTGSKIVSTTFNKSSADGEWYIATARTPYNTLVSLGDYGIDVGPSVGDTFTITVSKVDVEDEDEQKDNNAKYYAGEAATAKTAAEDAQGAAEEAQGAAELAQGLAETAQGIAVDAKNDAVTAKEAAESAKTDAESARDLAVEAKNDAVTAKNEAVSAKGSAEYARDEAAQYLEKMGFLYQAKLDKNPNGTDDLIDASHKIASSYLPPSILGGMTFRGMWDASTGTATPSATAEMYTAGSYWICTGAGKHHPGVLSSVGQIDYEIGDWSVIIRAQGLSHIEFTKVDNTDAVSSVNGQTGAVRLTAADIKTKNGESTVATDIAELESGLEGKLDNDAMSLASLMQGSKGMSVDVTEDDTYVDVHPDMTGATPGQVWKVNSAGTGAEWGEIGGGKIFEVTYGTTTFEQVTQALSDGKVPVCYYNKDNEKYQFIYSHYYNGYYYFTAQSPVYNRIVYLTLKQTNDTWSSSYSGLQPTSARVTSLTASSTDSQYPTAKATYTALNDIRKVAEGKCASYTVDETLTVERIKSDLTSYSGHAYYNGTDITESVLDGLYDSWIRNTEFASSSDTLSYGIDDFIAVEIPGYEGFILYNFGDMHTGDVLYVIGTGYPDRWASGDVGGGSTKTLYTLETVRKEAVGRTVTIQPSQWSNNTATVTVMGVTATNIVICDASDPDVQATAQNTNTLTFTCTKTPTVSVTVKVVIL